MAVIGAPPVAAWCLHGRLVSTSEQAHQNAHCCRRFHGQYCHLWTGIGPEQLVRFHQRPRLLLLLLLLLLLP